MQIITSSLDTKYKRCSQTYSFKNKSWAYSFRKNSKAFHSLSTRLDIRNTFTYTYQKGILTFKKKPANDSNYHDTTET